MPAPFYFYCTVVVVSNDVTSEGCGSSKPLPSYLLLSLYVDTVSLYVLLRGIVL